jgi:hypothetical protein
MASSTEALRSDSDRRRTRNVWRTSVAWWDRLRVALAPGPAARRGAIWAIVSLLGIFVAIHLIFLPSGYGIAFDSAFVMMATVIVTLVTAMIVALILRGLRHLPLVGTGVFVGACVSITLGSFSQPSVSLFATVISLCLTGCIIGAAIGVLTSRSTAESTIAKTALVSLLLAGAAACAIGFGWVLADDGDLEKVSSWRPRAESLLCRSGFERTLHG